MTKAKDKETAAPTETTGAAATSEQAVTEQGATDSGAKGDGDEEPATPTNPAPVFVTMGEVIDLLDKRRAEAMPANDDDRFITLGQAKAMIKEAIAALAAPQRLGGAELSVDPERVALDKKRADDDKAAQRRVQKMERERDKRREEAVSLYALLLEDVGSLTVTGCSAMGEETKVCLYFGNGEALHPDVDFAMMFNEFELDDRGRSLIVKPEILLPADVDAFEVTEIWLATPAGIARSTIDPIRFGGGTMLKFTGGGTVFRLAPPVAVDAEETNA